MPTDQKEDAIHENGGETDASIEGEESDPALPKDVILGNGQEGRETLVLKGGEEFGSSLQKEDLILQNGAQGRDSGPLNEGKESQPFPQTEDLILEDSGEERGTDALKEERSSTIGSNIVGDILYNLAVGDEDGHSRQRILAFAAKRYAANVERNPEDHDALYNWALVLQESADNTGPEMDSVSKDALLDEACKKYEAATQLCPSLHEAFYNWAIAISDRAKIRGRTKEAEELWKQACDKYEQAVQLNWNSPQALNNWGLALQELGAIVPLKEKRAIVKKGIRKFRAAIQLRFDFHRAVYNLGTVLYGLAEDTSRSGQKRNPKELAPADLYSLSAVYIAAAHALKPDYPVYRGALRLVRSMLPLPYMKSGWLKIAPPGNPLAPHSDWMRLWFVLDHEALYEMEKVDRKSLAHSYSKQVTFTESSGSSLPARPSMLRIAMEDIVHMAPSADLSLPPGGGFCIETVSGPQNLIAETWDATDSWVDAVRLVYTIYAQGKKDVLAGVLVG
ncbi:unnamed protein product [Sphagnum troendelagicum]|uniref:Uncharacterized protein n=1 Tax=Sphagnum troendelagicum TaxID=128251 RepID=A0ABP0T9Z9_9BRYO